MIYNKEAIYDEQIAPLMTQILQTCQAHGIQMVASFALMDQDPDYGNKPMLCTSYKNGDTWNAPELEVARQVLLGEKATLVSMIHTLKV